MFGSHVHDTDKRRKEFLDKAVDKRLKQLEQIERKRRRNALKFFHVKPAYCTQCNRGMDSYIAKLQLENKRDKAPICIPCITGKKRKPISDYVQKKMDARKLQD